MWLATLQFVTKLQKSIRMRITIQNFNLGRYNVRYTVGNHVLRLRSPVTVKLNFQPYIRQYTSPNENFEYSYPLNEPSRPYGPAYKSLVPFTFLSLVLIIFLSWYLSHFWVCYLSHFWVWYLSRFWVWYLSHFWVWYLSQFWVWYLSHILV